MANWLILPVYVYIRSVVYTDAILSLPEEIDDSIMDWRVCTYKREGRTHGRTWRKSSRTCWLDTARNVPPWRIFLPLAMKSNATAAVCCVSRFPRAKKSATSSESSMFVGEMEGYAIDTLCNCILRRFLRNRYMQRCISNGGSFDRL